MADSCKDRSSDELLNLSDVPHFCHRSEFGPVTAQLWTQFLNEIDFENVFDRNARQGGSLESFGSPLAQFSVNNSQPERSDWARGKANNLDVNVSILLTFSLIFDFQ